MLGFCYLLKMEMRFFKLNFKYLICLPFFCTPLFATNNVLNIEVNLEAKINPKCIDMSGAVASLTPPDLALGILECY